MNAAVETPLLMAQRLEDQIATAAARVAPSWPLDRFIAVNPYWGWVGHPMPQAAAALGTLAGTRLTMPREWFRAQWEAGRLQRRHLCAAAAQEVTASETNGASDAQLQTRVVALEAALQGRSAPLARLSLVTDLRDHGAPLRPGLSWADLVTHQISQHCAAFFDRHQSGWSMDTSTGLFGSWRRQFAADHSLPWRKSRAALRQRLAALAAVPTALIADALEGMAIPEEGREPYLPADLWQLFPDRLDDEGKPERWKTKPLSDLCTLGRGASPRPISDYMNGEVPWVKIADATASNGPFLFETKERVTTAGAEKSVPVVPGDLILSNSATCGVPMFVELNGCIHDGWLYFKNLKLISKMYLFHVLVELAEHLVQIADGSVQKNLNTKLVGQQSVLVPEPAIVESFDVRTNCWFATMRQNTLESRTLAQLRDSLLPKLISGELHIADAEGILEMRL